MASALRRNLQALSARRRSEAEDAGLQDKVADGISRFAGSMTFVYLHAALFSLWVPLNLGLVPGVPAFDPTFVILGTTTSCEAIFLSTFVLITQNRMTRAATRRADLDLQINLLAEHELTKLITLVSALARRSGLDVDADPELAEISRDVAPERVLDEIERHDGSEAGGP